MRHLSAPLACADSHYPNPIRFQDLVVTVVPAVPTEMMTAEMMSAVVTKAKGYVNRWCVWVTVTVSIPVAIRTNSVTSMRVMSVTMPAHVNRL